MTAFEIFMFAMLFVALIASACIMRVFSHKNQWFRALLMLVVVTLAQLGVFVGLFTKAQGVF